MNVSLVSGSLKPLCKSQGFFTALDTKEFREPRNSVLFKLEDVAIMSWRRAT